MVPPGLVALLRDRQAAELAAPDDERFVEEPAAGEILEQRGDRPIGLGGEAGVIAEDVGMTVPAALVLLAAGVDLDEAHAALDEPTGDEALLREVAAGGIVEAVEVVRLPRLAREVERLGRGHLHAVRQLEALDAGLQGRIVAGRRPMAAVESGGERELGTLLGVGERRVAGEIRDRCAGGVDARALEDSRQEARRPVRGVALGQAAPLRVVHDDESGQVAVLAAEAVGHPGARARVAHPRDAGVDLEERRTVRGVRSVQALHEAELIHDLRHVGEEFTHPGTALPVLAERPRAPQQVAGLGELHTRLGLRKWLAMVALQQRLVVEGVDL